MNLCDICKKRDTCSVMKKVKSETSKAIGDLLGFFKFDVVFTKCSKFEKDKKSQVECEYFCSYCDHKTTCDLWEQVCNIDEDFIRESFEYDPEVQSVCSTVSYCKRFIPINKKEE